MSEPIWCNIRLRIPATWSIPARSGDTDGDNPLVAGLSAALINGDTQHDDTCHGWEWTIEGEGNYGLYDDDVVEWLDWMRAHKVPFIASSDPKYEFEGETVVFDGTREFSGTSSSNQALLDHGTYQEILAGTSEFATIDDYFEVMNSSTTKRFSIDHLPADFPPEDD